MINLRKGHKCLFSAPYSFMPDIKEAYNSIIPTIFREIWYREEVEPDQSITVWVVNPGQRFVIDETILGMFPRLSALVTPSTGRNHIDIKACKERGVFVYSLLDKRELLEHITASAEFTFLLVLNTLRRLDIGIKEVTERRWRMREDLLRGYELSGKKVGLVGLGRIGRKMARYSKAFGAEVFYYDPYVEDDKLSSLELEELFAHCDIICICCTLNEETKGMVDRALLEKLKKGACLINTSRGEVINENDLFGILKERDDIKVSLDVLSGEVNNTHLSSPLIELHKEGRIVITPHIAGATIESQRKAAEIALKLIEEHINNI